MDHVFTYAPKPGAGEAIKNLISDICVSMKVEDYLELPPCTTVTIPVLLDNKAKAAYEKLEDKGTTQERLMNALKARIEKYKNKWEGWKEKL